MTRPTAEDVELEKAIAKTMRFYAGSKIHNPLMVVIEEARRARALEAELVTLRQQVQQVRELATKQIAEWLESGDDDDTKVSRQAESQIWKGVLALLPVSAKEPQDPRALAASARQEPTTQTGEEG